MTKTVGQIREYLLSRTGNHPEDIREANAIADEIERLQDRVTYLDQFRLWYGQSLQSADEPSEDHRDFVLLHILNELENGERDFTRQEVAAHLREEVKRLGLRPPEKSSEPSEDEAARLDRAYRDGARQAASMAHQSLSAMDDWIAGGCGNRCSPLQSEVKP